jgi:hypothetical protein
MRVTARRRASPAHATAAPQAWEPQPELRGRPRTVRLTRGYRRLGWVVALAVLLMLLGYAWPVVQRRTVLTQGEAVQGVVTAKDSRSVRGGSGGIQWHYYLGVTYPLAGEDHAAEVNVGSKAYARHAIGEHVELRVLPRAPDSPVLVADTAPRSLALAAGAALLLLVPAGVGLAVRDARRILAAGTAVRGEVAAVRESPRGRRLLTVHYDHRGTPYEAVFTDRLMPRGNTPRTGDAITLLLDPRSTQRRDAGRHALLPYPMRGFEVS